MPPLLHSLLIVLGLFALGAACALLLEVLLDRHARRPLPPPALTPPEDRP